MVLSKPLEEWKRDKESQIPLVVIFLVESIEKLGGLETEGIFRLSPMAKELNYARKKIEGGDFSLKHLGTDPHVPAALLKEWMRGLSTPLLEARHITEFEACQDLFYVLPAVNFQVLRYISQFCQKILSPETQQKTRMNLDNLGIIFAPCFFRIENMAFLQSKIKFTCWIISSLYKEKSATDKLRDELPDLTVSLIGEVIQKTPTEAVSKTIQDLQGTPCFSKELVDDLHEQIPDLSKDEIEQVLKQHNWELATAVPILVAKCEQLQSNPDETQQQQEEEEEETVNECVSLSVKKEIISPNGRLPINFIIHSGEVHENDFVGVYENDSSSPVKEMKVHPFVDSSKETIQGTLNFTAPLSCGEMKVKYIRGSECLGSTTIQVGPVFEMSTQKEDNKLVVNWKKIKGKSYYMSWIGLYKKEAKNDDFLEFFWCHNLVYSEVSPINFTLPSSPGEYEVRLVLKDNILGSSVAVSLE